MSATYLTKFNNTLEQLIESLQEVVRDDYPDLEKTLRMFGDRLNMLRKANPRKIMDGFIYWVYPYREEILNKQESFFLGHSFQEVSESGYDSIVNMLHIKEIWKEYATPQIKETIWDYFQVMILLCERFADEKGGMNNFSLRVRNE
jgi:hypothetical protein